MYNAPRIIWQWRQRIYHVTLVKQVFNQLSTKEVLTLFLYHTYLQLSVSVCCNSPVSCVDASNDKVLIYFQAFAPFSLYLSFFCTCISYIYIEFFHFVLIIKNKNNLSVFATIIWYLEHRFSPFIHFVLMPTMPGWFFVFLMKRYTVSVWVSICISLHDLFIIWYYKGSKEIQALKTTLEKWK